MTRFRELFRFVPRVTNFIFHQAVSGEKYWRAWDDFSQSSSEVFADRLQDWEASAEALLNCGENAEVLDAKLLKTSMRIVREQLIDIAPQNSQSTFHLTIVTAGLSEAMESACCSAWADRIAEFSRACSLLPKEQFD